jgi:hypothetical protein
MEIISYDKATSEVITKLTLRELTVFKNALNETVHGPNAVVESEFDTRVGMPFGQAKEFLETASDMVHSLDESYRVIK